MDFYGYNESYGYFIYKVAKSFFCFFKTDTQNCKASP